MAARALIPSSDKATSGTETAVKDTSLNMSGVDRKAMEQERLARLGKRKRELSPIPSHELFNPLEGQEDAWQLGEPVDDFARRLPPDNTAITTFPWIWAANPHRNPRDKSPSPRVEDFTSRGMDLLEQSLQTRRNIQKEGARGPRGMVTKQLNQESKALQGRISSLANETNVLSGKWMLFPKSVDVTRVWKQIVANVIDNRLGCTCKVATDDGKEERLICVYTKDFQDADDVLRVLHELENMGLLNGGKTIYYKPDAYTYLNLVRDTAAEYGLQASLYNSRSLLAADKVPKSASTTQKKQSTLSGFL
ncbi:hypothetical protein AA0118_g1643 [Alternaria tenuissima]|nr:hypothetical protein AA0118_g1643 [Alternaria tenuissima]